MAGQNVPIVLIPRYTTYVGTGDFRTIPIPVSAYEALVLNFINGNMIGSGTVILSCQETNDLQTWTACTGDTPAVPSPFQEIQWRFNVSKAWLRFTVSLNGNNIGFTCAAQGFFEKREK